MGADPSALPKLEEAMLAELDRARGDIGDEELAAFKSYASGRLAVRRADPDQAARLWLDALLRGEDDAGPRRAADQAAKLTRKDITAAAQRMLDPSRRHIVVIDRQAQAAPAR
jgi:predicted Zn-dependent peptidase